MLIYKRVCKKKNFLQNPAYRIERRGFSDEKQKKLYDEVVLKTRKIYALNEQMMSHPDKASINVLEKEKNRIIVDIQELIGKVYRQEI